MTETNKLFYQSEMVFDFSRYRRILRRLFSITDNQVTDLNPNKNKTKNEKEVLTMYAGQIIALHVFALASGATIALGALLLALLKLRDLLDYLSSPNPAHLNYPNYPNAAHPTRSAHPNYTSQERRAIEAIIKEMEEA